MAAHAPIKMSGYENLTEEINAETISCDAGDIRSVHSLFESIDKTIIFSKEYT